MNDSWKQALWEALDTLPPEQQFVESGELITWISHTLLAELAQRRREAVITMRQQQGLSNAEVAEALGMRRSAVVRLVEEGQAARKERRHEVEPDPEDVQHVSYEEGLLTPHPSL